MAVADDRQRHEQADGNEEQTGDEQGDEQGGVYRAPVGSRFRRLPGTQYVEQYRCDDDEHQDNCKYHVFCILFLSRTGSTNILPNSKVE
ncbi:hypothetical protein D3C80_1777490 [compost metagenome]